LIKLFILLFCQNLFSAWAPIKDVPFELEAIIKSAGSGDLEYQEKAKVSLGKVFNFYNNLEKKDFYYIFKVSTYKYLLREKPETRIPVNYFNSPFLNKFIRKNPPTHLQDFEKWLWSALVKDVDLIMRDPNYYRFVEAKKKNEMKDSFAILDKKIRLIIPWLIFMKTQDKVELEIYMRESYLKILDHAAINMKIFATLKEKANAKLPLKFDLSPYISIKKSEPTKKEDKAIDTINSIVKDITEDELPKPTDDWKLDSDEFLPKDDTELPTPVDDWLNEF
jgi:hypothetical protein